MMSPGQKQRAYKSFLDFFAYDWVQLPAVVAIVNEVVGFEPYGEVTPEAREFVAALIEEEKVVVGSLDHDARFAAWSDSKSVQLKRVMDQMPIGGLNRNEQLVWFDSPQREKP